MEKDEITTNSLAHTKWDCKYHIAYEQMSVKELVDPFTGEPVKASKK